MRAYDEIVQEDIVKKILRSLIEKYYHVAAAIEKIKFSGNFLFVNYLVLYNHIGIT